MTFDGHEAVSWIVSCCMTGEESPMHHSRATLTPRTLQAVPFLADSLPAPQQGSKLLIYALVSSEHLDLGF